MSARTDKLKSHLDQALEITRTLLAPGRSRQQLDDATVASRFHGIVAALVVAAAIEELRQEVAE